MAAVAISEVVQTPQIVNGLKHACIVLVILRVLAIIIPLVFRMGSFAESTEQCLGREVSKSASTDRFQDCDSTPRLIYVCISWFLVE